MDPALIIFLIIVLALLLFLSCLFSSAETSLIAVSTAKLNRLRAEKSTNATFVLKLKNNKEQVMGAILIGNNVINILTSSISTAIAFELFGAVGVVVSSIMISVLIIVFAEVLPKTYAINNPEKVSLLIGPFMYFCVKGMQPLTKLVSGLVNLVLKIFGKEHTKESTSATEALRNLVIMHKNNEIGEVNKNSLEIINGILDLAEIDVEKLMTHRKDILSINIDLNKSDIIKQTINSAYNYIPLWKSETDNVVALINAHKVSNLLHNHSAEEVDIQKALEKPLFILDKTTINVVLHNFKQSKVNFALVQDEYGSLKGIVTLSDIVEEILGDMFYYEYDNKCDILYLKENCYSVSGKTRVKEINAKLGWSLPYSNSLTVAGIIIYELEKIPKKGEEYILNGYTFKMLNVQHNSISRVQISKIAE